MVVATRASFKANRNLSMDSERRFGLTEQSTLESGDTAKPRAREYSTTRMAMCSKGSSKPIKPMDTAAMCTKQASGTTVSGLTTCSKESAPRH